VDPKKFVRTTSHDHQIGVLPIPPNGYGVAEVHGRVFDDLNNNGIQDPGEKPVSGLQIDASERGVHLNPIPWLPAPDYPHARAITDADGNFTLTGLKQDDYTLSASDYALPDMHVN